MDTLINIVKELIKILIVLVGVAIVIIIGVFIYQKISVSKEEDLYKVNGELVKVYDDEFMNVVSYGSGDKTIVVLGDTGVLVPSLEYQEIAKKLGENYQVLIVELLGHGYSSDTDNDRTVENIVEEIRTVLSYKKYDDKYILMSHGFAGMYALYYANTYEKEVEALINLDTNIGLQLTYDFDLAEEYPHYYSFYSKLGLSRFLSDLIPDQVGYSKSLNGVPKLETERFKYLYSTRMYNDTYINEINAISDNLEAFKNTKYKMNTPVLDLLSKTTINTIENNKEYSIKFVELHTNIYTNNLIQKYNEIDGNHNLYRGNIDIVVKAINDFINTTVK